MFSLADVIQPPLLTSDLPGIDGKIKAIPEDFEVEEIPAYEPSGQGDFLYLWIEKRDMGAEFFTRQVARRLDMPVGEVGTAGLKDRRAVTRQMVSVPAGVEERLPQLEGEGIKVLRVSRHSNKLRAGHLHGNRFRILVRLSPLSGGEGPTNLSPLPLGEGPTNLSPLPLGEGPGVRDMPPVVPPSPPTPLPGGEGSNAATPLPGGEGSNAIIDRIREHGLPNYYGTQRLGHDGETLQMGMALLRGEKPAKPIRSPFLKKLALSSAQSALFNHSLAQRFRDGLLRRVLPGDVMCKIPFGGMFVAVDVETEQKRFDAREIVSAGAIFGRKTFAAEGEAAQREQAALSAFGLTETSFNGFGKLLQGTRRHNLIYVDDLAAASEPEGLRLTFTLPAGSYATVLLREFVKTGAMLEDAD